MDQLNKLNSTLASFTKKFGLPTDTPQGSDEWSKLKLGVISASDASKAVAKKGSETRNSYMCQLVAQVCAGEREEINGKALEWGKFHEASARSYYSLEHNVDVLEAAFYFKDNTFRVGCSPDGLIVQKEKGLELKCPYSTANYIKFLCADDLKSDYRWQVQFSMWVTGLNLWDVSQYDPRMKTRPLHTITVERDEKSMEIFDELIPEFILEMDQLLEKAGAKFSDQWTR